MADFYKQALLNQFPPGDPRMQPLPYQPPTGGISGGMPFTGTAPAGSGYDGSGVNWDPTGEIRKSMQQEQAGGGLGAFSTKMTSWDPGKFADPNKSEKYKIGEVMSRFDPRQGVTPDLLAALNALGIADFSGSGDQLTVVNSKNDPRFGKGGTADVVKGLKGNNADTMWAPWFVDEGQAAGGRAMPTGASVTGYALPDLLSGDALGSINAALTPLIARSPNLAALIAQLGR